MNRLERFYSKLSLRVKLVSMVTFILVIQHSIMTDGSHILLYPETYLVATLCLLPVSYIALADPRPKWQLVRHWAGGFALGSIAHVGLLMTAVIIVGVKYDDPLIGSLIVGIMVGTMSALTLGVILLPIHVVALLIVMWQSRKKLQVLEAQQAFE